MSLGSPGRTPEIVREIIGRCRAVFFDFDGVLADSVHVKTRAFGELFAEHGEDVRQRVVEHHLANGGMSRFDKFRHYYTEFLGAPLNEAGMVDLCGRFAKLVVSEVVASPEIPGAGEFLVSLLPGRDLFVVSATPEAEIQEIVRLRGMEGLFREVCGSPVGKGEHVARILDEYGLAAQETVFFGDAASDFDAAESAAVPFVGVASSMPSALLDKRPVKQWIEDFTSLLRG